MRQNVSNSKHEQQQHKCEQNVINSDRNIRRNRAFDSFVKLDCFSDISHTVTPRGLTRRRIFLQNFSHTVVVGVCFRGVRVLPKRFLPVNAVSHDDGRCADVLFLRVAVFLPIIEWF